MSALSREEILQADDLEVVEVEVPEWDGTVCLRELSGAEREDFINDVVDDPSSEDPSVDTRRLFERLLVRTICDGEGELLFQPGDVDALSEKSAPAIQRLFLRAQQLSGLRDEDIEELTGN